jgi:hypothetical protein
MSERVRERDRESERERVRERERERKREARKSSRILWSTDAPESDIYTAYVRLTERAFVVSKTTWLPVAHYVNVLPCSPPACLPYKLRGRQAGNSGK